MRKEEISLACALVPILIFTVLSIPPVSGEKVPLLQDLPSEIFACEGEVLAFNFTATDEDGDELSVDLYPKGPIYIEEISSGAGNLDARLFSEKFKQNDVGKIFESTVFVYDSTFVESKDIRITVVEVNSPPEIEEIEIQTISLSSDEPLFYQEVMVTDSESSDNLEYSLRFKFDQNLFEISDDGILSFEPTASDVGVYDLEVCVSDSGIPDSQDQINCDQDGSSLKSCENFQLTITNENIKPTIMSFFPQTPTLDISSKDKLYFNVSNFDPDGTSPDIKWYLEDELIKYDESMDFSELEYEFGCGISGQRVLTAVISDGLKNDTVQWAFTISEYPCEPNEQPRDLIDSCDEKWGCQDWGVCQHTAQSKEVGVISDEEFDSINEKCEFKGWGEVSCGLQIRPCIDVNECPGVSDDLPGIRECFFVFSPSCTDGLKNCHENKCEILADCGGPCDACDSCSDNRQNQGEEGVDCGGPCHEECRAETPFNIAKIVKIAIVAGLIVAAVVGLLILLRIRHIKKKMSEITSRKDDENGEPTSTEKQKREDFNINKPGRINLR